MTERTLQELYAEDPERADAQLWGRRATRSRRGFLRDAGLGALSAALGLQVPMAHAMPAGLVPAAFAAGASGMIAGKSGLHVLNERPLNAETPAHLLDADLTPAAHLFVRNNGIPPRAVDAASWTLRVDGEAARRPRTFSLAELKREFTHHTYRLQLECGGNGRSEFSPPASGNQWSTGAVGCVEWTGVRLRDVLDACGMGPDAVYVGYYGADTHLSGDPGKHPISRGVPVAKARQDESLLAFAMNGEDIPALHGAPLRMVCAGWPASASGKWVNRLVIRDRVHDGEKMGGSSYRVPCRPVAPGATVSDADMCIIESMPVKSLITLPRSGIRHDRDRPLLVRGHAWAGDLDVADVQLSIDFGAHWYSVLLDAPPNRLAWQRFSGVVRFPQTGYYEIWARAVDSAGNAQPMVLPGWNPKGYLNNACHRVAVQAT